jgi:hypothetical protein
MSVVSEVILGPFCEDRALVPAFGVSFENRTVYAVGWSPESGEWVVIAEADIYELEFDAAADQVKVASVRENSLVEAETRGRSSICSMSNWGYSTLIARTLLTLRIESRRASGW